MDSETRDILLSVQTKETLDGSIHVTEDQMKNLIINQLQPIALSVKEVQVTLPNQQKQLDCIE